MELAPICVFSYNRPEHLKRTLEALSKNDLAGDSVLYIFCDGAKELSDGVDKINVGGNSNTAKRYFDGTNEEYKRYLKSIDDNIAVAKSQTWPKELNVIVQPHNKGLAKSIVQGVTDIVNKYGKIIMLEDDIVTSIGFLKFMNEALKLYKEEEKVMHISAYMYPHKCKLPDTFFYPVPYPGGGWATWKRAWKYYNDNTQELYDYWESDWKKFNTNGGDYFQKQLYDNLVGTLSTWFIKWHAVMLQRDALTLYPGKSLTNNIGFNDGASNCYATTKFEVVPVDYVNVQKTPVVVNKKGARVIYDFYQGHWYNKRRRNAFLKKILTKLHLIK